MSQEDRKDPLYQRLADTGPLIGIDVGGTSLHGIIGSHGTLIASAFLPSISGHEGVVAGCLEMIEVLTARSGIPIDEVVAVGLGVPGLVSADGQTVRHAVNLGIGDEPLHLAEQLRSATGSELGVIMDNDLNVAALGAAFLVPEPDGAPPELAYLSLGTGVAAGFVLKGELWRGQGAAGEIGHLPYDRKGPLCKCGQRGCLEMYVSGAALDRLYPAADGRPAGTAMFADASVGLASAVAVRDQFARAVASAVQALFLTVDVRRVLIGGGVAEIGAPLLECVRRELANEAASVPFLDALDLPSRVHLAPTDPPASAVGAAVLALRALPDQQLPERTPGPPPGRLFPLVPMPVSLTAHQGRLATGLLRLAASDNSSDWLPLAAELLGPVGVTVTTEPVLAPQLLLGPATTWRLDAEPESYRLVVTTEQVSITAPDRAGTLNGLRTLAQLFGAGMDPTQSGGGSRPSAPTVTIVDGPRYPWRGLSLDIARHWHPPGTIKMIIDLAAAYKLNRLHLHLSDDQGWRIEVPSYPELTRISGRTQMGGEIEPGERGYLTLAEYSDLQAYAAARCVTIVPEIDLPGHVNAALHALPDLNPDGRAPASYGGMEVGFSRLWLDNPATKPFLTTMLTEIADATHGPWFHIGGDEVLELGDAEYQGLVAFARDVVRSAGKTPVAWQEAAPVADAGMVLQYWDPRPDPGAQLAAVARGAKLLMSPATRAYLDMKVEETDRIGQAWAAFIDLETAWGWDPAEVVENLDPTAIIGVEAALWTETLATCDDLTAMLLPRLPATAETAWSPRKALGDEGPDGGGFEDFLARLEPHRVQWARRGYRFRPRDRWLFRSDTAVEQSGI